ncbi:4'-phosphopantetheinyl transferase superfamily protein [Tumidithrix elongata RA019]|uniref:4'-phosphopantetheinyl transferase superfamily protein n=1 Tax=Tumidithrix elongata BACA0141 TaxID=2716417 RepID=A0AAW9PUB0_9CYAN|nr:4'-phosphopantetheinyl transferase superfamily protein [Tumidithrix elongata RA019]
MRVKYSSFQSLNLQAHEVHLWYVDLQLTDRLLEFKAILSPDEQQRADRYRFDLHRQRFIVARGHLRTILGRYLDIQPTQVQFTYSPSGKPQLADRLWGASTMGAGNLEFNLSHAENLAVYAVTSNRAIGVDVECQQRPIEDVEQLAQRFFSRQESERLRSLPPQEQQELFLQIWTLKEAYLKATGKGLVDLERVQTDWQGERLVGLVFPDREQTWQAHQFQPQPDYVAALVVGGAIERLIEIVPDGAIAAL